MNDHRVLGVALVVLAALLLANPLYIYQYPDQKNEVSIGETRYERSPSENFSFEELSPRAQELVEAAIESDTNSTTFRGDDRRPSEFDFSKPVDDQTDAFVGEVYRVEYEGQNYTVTTFQHPRSIKPETRRSQTLLGLGLVIALIGVLYVWREQPPLLGGVVGGAGFIFLLLNVGYRYTDNGLGAFGLFGSWPFMLLGLLGSITAAGYLLYLTNRERRLNRYR
jgi:hypothetical protein